MFKRKAVLLVGGAAILALGASNDVYDFGEGRRPKDVQRKSLLIADAVAPLFTPMAVAHDLTSKRIGNLAVGWTG